MAKFAISAYIADGTTTDYLITWNYLDQDHISVYVDGTSDTDPNSTHIFNLINSTTVRVTDELGNAISSGAEIEIRRETPIQNRAVTFADGSALLAEDLNKNSDYLLYSMQEALDTVESAAGDAALQAQTEAEANRDETLALKNTTAGYLATVQADTADADAHRIAAQAAQTAAEAAQTSAETAESNVLSIADGFDDTYLGSKTSDPTTDNDGDAISDGALYYNTTDNVLKVYDLATTAWVRATPTNADQININTLSAISADITTVAGDTVALNVLSQISADLQTLADIEDGTVATNALSTLAPISTAITTAASNISAIQNAPTEAANAAASAAAASTSESNAATSAAAALSSQNAAAASATAASTSETNAATSETALDTAWASFNQRYLGAKASAPTVDNLGNAIIDGALYWDTTNSEMYVYTNGGWGVTQSGLATVATTGDYNDLVNIPPATASSLVTYASDPATGNEDEGDIYYNTTNGVIRVYNGSAWVNVTNEPPQSTGGTVVLTSVNSGSSVSYDLSSDFTDAEDAATDLTYTSSNLPSFLTLPSAGSTTITGTAPTVSTDTNYNFTVTATDIGGASVNQNYQITVLYVIPSGDQVYTTAGTYSWTCPSGVSSVCVVCVGGGGAGISSPTVSSGGGGLGWKNNIPVTAGQSYTVVVGKRGQRVGNDNISDANGGDSYFINTNTVAGFGGVPDQTLSSLGQYGGRGSYTGDGGGFGGHGVYSSGGTEAGGGGAGGYSGDGGYGGYGDGSSATAAASGSGGAGGGGGAGDYTAGGGGGVGLYGQGASGSAGNSTSASGSQGGHGGAGSGGTTGYYTSENSGPSGSPVGSPQSTNLDGIAGSYGGGGYGRFGNSPNAYGAVGAVRIMWGGNKSFPNNANQQVMKMQYIIKVTNGVPTGFPMQLSNAVEAGLVDVDVNKDYVTAQELEGSGYGLFKLIELPPNKNPLKRIVEKTPVEKNTDGEWLQNWSLEDYEASDEEVLLKIQQNKLLEKRKDIRTKRNKLLQQSDFTQISDVPFNKSDWSAYRQSLREITEQEGFELGEVVWPEPPFKLDSEV